MAILTPFGDWNPSYLYYYGQLEDSNDNMISGNNVSATSCTEYNDLINPILSVTQYNPPSTTFADDVAFTKGATEDEFFFDITELENCKFDNWRGPDQDSPFDIVICYIAKLVPILK